MARSARSTIAGLNLQKIDGARLSDLMVRSYVLYDESAAFAPELRSRVPDALITLRLIQNSHWGDPEGTARAGAGLVAAYPQVDRLCPGNEQNLENHASPGQIAAWCERFFDEWVRQGRPRPLVTPAVSPGVEYNLAALKDAWAEWDIIGVHAYTTLDDLAFNGAKSLIGAHRQTWPSHLLALTEFNIDKLEETTYRHQEGANAVSAFLDWCAAQGYLIEAEWFLDDAWHDDQPYRLTHIPPLMDLYRAIGHEQGGNPGPEPEPPQPPVDGIAVKYNLIVTETADIGVRFEDDQTGQVELVAVMAPGTTGSLRTADGQNGVDGAGTLAVIMADTSKYFPENGQHGPWNATCAGARVEGLGMKPDHTHPKTTFYRKSTPPPSGIAWSGAFQDYAAAHPEVGQAIGDIAYHPEPGAWRTAGQVSATHLLIWDGNRVHEIRRG